MSLGLDLGTNQLRSARISGKRILTRNCRASYALAADTQAQRRVFDRMHLPWAKYGDNLVLMSDGAHEWSYISKIPQQRIFREETIIHSGAATQVLSTMIEGLIPVAKTPEVCCLTLPCTIEDRRHSLISLNYMTELIRARGYQPVFMGQALAVILAELGKAHFTGIGMTLGMTCTEFSLARQGRELARVTIPLGGRDVDRCLLEILCQHPVDDDSPTELDMIEYEKEHEEPLILGGDAAGEKIREVFQEFLRKVLEQGMQELREQLQHFKLQSIPLVYAGGLTTIQGFPQLFQELISQVSLPFEISQSVCASNSKTAVARGCLINAELEQQVNIQAA